MKKLVIAMIMPLLLGGCGFQDLINQRVERFGDSVEYSMYKGSISGIDVQTAASLYANRDVSIYVRTGVNKTGFYVQSGGCYALDKDSKFAVPAKGCNYVTRSQIKDDTDQNHYVYGAGNFNSKLYTNKKGLVKLMVIDQVVK
jgi:hypothetical protein